MTTLNEISNMTNLPQGYSIPNTLSQIDIGNYSFDNWKKIDEYIILFTNKNDPNIKLIYNEERQIIVLYLLNQDDTIDATSWKSNKKIKRTLNKKQINPKIYGE